LDWKDLEVKGPTYFFVHKDFTSNDEYLSFFSISELFKSYSAGIQSKRDDLFIDEDKVELGQRINKLLTENLDEYFINKFNIKDSSSYKITQKIKQVKFKRESIIKAHYRPFDDKYIYYDAALIGRAFFNTMSHLIFTDNLGLVVSKQFIDTFKYIFISNKICDMNLISSAGSFGAGFSYPLYLYPPNIWQQSVEKVTERTPNLNVIIVNQIAESINLQFTPEKEPNEGTFAPIDLLDYIYAVLHSPNYREKYKEFLKIDFPRVPYPKDAETFWQLVKLGGELRQLHLMESPALNSLITQYPVGGSNQVEKVAYEDGKAYINKDQYFANVPQLAWEFYIGGYQPAQKWLKDRKGQALLFDDILHYQKIIVALSETDRIMGEIDKINIEL
jgi:predicted helicase